VDHFGRCHISAALPTLAVEHPAGGHGRPDKDGFDVAFGTGPLQDSQAVEQPALHRLRLQRATQAHDPFELSFSTLISAFYEAACEIITEKSARV
jgi:hypothetical protein